MAVRNVHTSAAKKQADRLRKTETAAPLGSASVSRGRTRFIGEESLLVEGSSPITGGVTSAGVPGVEGSKGILYDAPAGFGLVSKLAGACAIAVAAAEAFMTFGANSVSVQSARTLVTGDLTVQAGYLRIQTTTSTGPANAVIDSATGLVTRSSSSLRFKRDVQKLELDPRILAVSVYDWEEAGKPGTPRIAGTIAEFVEAAGGAPFITRTPEGRVEGVAYDRLALARTQLLLERLDAAEQKIAELTRDSTT